MNLMSAIVRPAWANATPTIQRKTSYFTACLDSDRCDIAFEFGLDRREIRSDSSDLRREIRSDSGDLRREIRPDGGEIGLGGDFFAQRLVQTLGQGPRLALAHAGGLEPVDIGQLVDTQRGHDSEPRESMPRLQHTVGCVQCFRHALINSILSFNNNQSQVETGRS